MKAYEELTELEQLASEYSDFHKEAYGFRPRHSTAGWTVADFKKVFEKLGKICEANAIEQADNERYAAAKFEKDIAKLIGMGAADRAAAIRWLHQANGTDGDNGFLEYTLGLSYGYLHQNEGEHEKA